MHGSAHTISCRALVSQHVPRKICFLCIRLTTNRADLGLQMFGLTVLRNMITQRRFVAEALVAGVAAKWTIGHVAAHVALEIGQL